jgi:hypothetical protein
MIEGYANQEEFINALLKEWADERVRIMLKTIADKTLVRTGNLRDSIKVVRAADGMASITQPFYGRILDMNTWRSGSRILNRVAWGSTDRNSVTEAQRLTLQAANRQRYRKVNAKTKKQLEGQYKDTAFYARNTWRGVPKLKEQLRKGYITFIVESLKPNQ